jgi:hypothetical protein
MQLVIQDTIHSVQHGRRRNHQFSKKIPATHSPKKGAIMVQLKIPEQLEPRNTQKYTPATWGA